MMNKRVTRVLAALTGTALAAGLAACAGTPEPPAPGTATTSAVPTASPTAAEIEAALDTESTLTVWSWSLNVAEIGKAFHEKYPKITVNVENVGSAVDTYTKLQNAIAAGTGGPDVATIEYHTLPQFALGGGLTDLRELGLDKHKDLFEPSVWENFTINGGLYELPRGFGPTALFYNEKALAKYGVEVPATWDEFYEAAKRIHAADPKAYIAADTGEANLTNSLIWAAGGRPYDVDGSNLTIDLADDGTSRFAEMWGRLLDEGLLAPIPMWSNEWYQGLGDGTIASVASGAWLVGILESGLEAGSGDWRVAPLPSFDAANPSSSLNGGGGDAILAQSKNKVVAAAFLEFMSTGAGVQVSLDMGFYPATVADMTAPEFVGSERPYFGGQHINEVFLESARTIKPGWQFLPYNAYSSTIFPETVGKAYLGEKSLVDGLRAWQDELRSFGTEQGFTVQ